MSGSSEEKAKAGLIRWPGLIAFVAVVLVFAGVWFLVAGAVVKRVIERTGTAAVGAEVELEKAALSLFPLGLTLTRLQVTNPDQPMTNAVEVGRIGFTMDGPNLLRRKVIIEEMTLEGVRFGTPRTEAGAVVRPRPESAVASQSTGEPVAMPSLKVPDVNEILKQEDLRSLKLVESARADLQTGAEQWRKRLAELPDKARLDEYRQRFERLTSARKGGLGGLLSGAQEMVGLQQDVSKELDRIRAAKSELEAGLSQWRKRLDEAARAPQEDVRRLKEKCSFSGQGVANVSRLLFGGEIAGWVENAYRWRARLAPVLQHQAASQAGHEVVKPLRGTGVDVRFKETAPLPDFLVRLAQASVELPAGTVTGRIRNITPDQPVLRAPLAFEFTGEKLHGVESLKLAGSINRVEPATPVDTVSLRARAYRLGPLALGTGVDRALSLKQGTADVDLDATLTGEAIQGTIAAGLKGVQIAGASPEKGDALAAAVAATPGGIKTFRLKAEVTGTRDRYEVQLRSDLEQVLKETVGKQLTARAARFEAELQSAIAQKTNGPLNELKTAFGGLEGLNGELESRLNIGADLLKGGKGSGPPGLKLPF